MEWKMDIIQLRKAQDLLEEIIRESIQLKTILKLFPLRVDKQVLSIEQRGENFYIILNERELAVDESLKSALESLVEEVHDEY